MAPWSPHRSTTAANRASSTALLQELGGELEHDRGCVVHHRTLANGDRVGDGGIEAGIDRHAAVGVPLELGAPSSGANDDGQLVELRGQGRVEADLLAQLLCGVSQSRAPQQCLERTSQPS
jgi:hypothetical protein